MSFGREKKKIALSLNQKASLRVKPLYGSQLKKWQDYLNFAEKQGDSWTGLTYGFLSLFGTFFIYLFIFLFKNINFHY